MPMRIAMGPTDGRRPKIAITARGDVRLMAESIGGARPGVNL
jgi:hypothetical protein